LAVDDEPVIADLFRQRFRREARDGTYVMRFATVMRFTGSAAEALDQLAEEIEPELIVPLSDINRPGVDRLELLREVKRRRPVLPAMSGWSVLPEVNDIIRVRRESARDRRQMAPDQVDLDNAERAAKAR
jgi:CheY-like chemotaxis protein